MSQQQSPGTPQPTPPGWYTVSADGERWWDGTQWGPQERPLTQPTAAMSQSARKAGWAMVAGGILTVFAALMPWASVGPFTINGTSGDGAITLVMGLVAIVAGIGRGVAKSASGWQLAIPFICLVLGALVALVGLIDIGDVSGKGSVGIGLVLTFVAGLGLVGAAVWGILRRT